MGPKMGQKMAQKWVKKGVLGPFPVINASEMGSGTPKMAIFGPFLGPFLTPYFGAPGRSGQNGPKRSRTAQNRWDFQAFLSPTGPHWPEPSGGPKYPKKRGQKWVKNREKGSKMAPKVGSTFWPFFPGPASG